MSEDFLTTAEIADKLGWHRTTAWRRVARLREEQRTRRGNRIGLTPAQLEAWLRNMRPPIDDRIERRLADLEERMLLQENRTDQVVVGLKDVQRTQRG